MRIFILPLMLFIFAAICAAQPRKSDRELDGLKGQVHQITDAGMTKTYDQNGDLIQTEIGPNCFIKSVFSRVAVMSKTMKEHIMDASNSGYCTREREGFPREGNDVSYTINYKFDYNDAISSYQNSESYIWVHNEEKKIGDNHLWRKSQYFDQSSRLLEELFVDRNLIAYTTIYKYVAKDTDPIAAEFLTNNRFYRKDWYRYDKYDAQGNWTKRTTIKIEPENMTYSPQEINRKISYY